MQTLWEWHGLEMTHPEIPMSSRVPDAPVSFSAASKGLLQPQGCDPQCEGLRFVKEVPVRAQAGHKAGSQVSKVQHVDSRGVPFC